MLGVQACGVLVEGPASYPFDEDAPKGFLRCEGTGAMVLRRTSEAVEQGDRILAEIVGAIAASAGSADGCTEGAGRVYEQPCAKGMREMFKRCTTTNGIATSDIDYMGQYPRRCLMPAFQRLLGDPIPACSLSVLLS